jgi:hypothetical protein
MLLVETGPSRPEVKSHYLIRRVEAPVHNSPTPEPASKTLRLPKKGIRMSVESIVAAHLEVWNAPAGPAREKAIAQVYTADVVANEPGERLSGHAGVEQAVAALQAQLAGMAITRSGPLQEVQDLVTYPFTIGAEGGPTIVSGRDVLIIRDGKVSSLFVLIDS